MRDDFLIQELKAAAERRRQMPPEERFESLVRRGVIDREGRVLLRMPEPPEDEAKAPEPEGEEDR